MLWLIETRRQRLTTAITTLDYYIQSNSLHAAHVVGFKERGTNVIAVDVICHARRWEFNELIVRGR